MTAYNAFLIRKGNRWPIGTERRTALDGSKIELTYGPTVKAKRWRTPDAAAIDCGIFAIIGDIEIVIA